MKSNSYATINKYILYMQKRLNTSKYYKIVNTTASKN